MKRRAPPVCRDRPAALVAALYAQSEGDPFYLQFLAQDILNNEVQSIADVQSRPKGLAGYLDRWWDELQEDVDDPAVQDLLGYLLVAQGGLTRSDLIGISAKDHLKGINIDKVIKTVWRFIVGTEALGYKLCHPRFRDHLTDGKIPQEDQAPYREALLQWCAKWEELDETPEKHRYALLYYASELLEAYKVAPGDKGLQHLRALVALLANPKFQESALRETGDLAALQHDFYAAVRCVAESPGDVCLLAEIALAMETISQTWLKPEAVFALVKEGKPASARRRLDLFSVDDRWFRVALLVIAWLAASGSKADAREFIAKSGALLREVYDDTLVLLRDRVLFAAGEMADAPELALPYAPRKLPDYALSQNSYATWWIESAPAGT
jgi:hypothetical protein